MEQITDTEAQRLPSSLSEIAKRKEILLKQIRRNQKDMEHIYRQLRQKDKPKGRRKVSFHSLIGTSAGVIDGLIVAWKLYRKFKK